MSVPAPANIWSVILAGGRGTRIAELYPDLPKPLIPALGEPFIEWVIRYLAGQGVGRHMVSLGHKAPVALAHFASRDAGRAAEALTIRTVVEPAALGTGGGVRFAWDALPPGSPIIACNGDSLVLADLSPAWAAFERADTDAVILGVRVSDAGRYGSLDIASDGRLRGFLEKRAESSGKPGVINAGVYIMKPHVRRDFADVSPLSIEQGVFPAMLAAGRRIVVVAADAPFLDIGTPESVGQAEDFLRSHFNAAASPHGAPA